MNAGDVIFLAADGAGRVFASDGSARIAAVEESGLRRFAELPAASGAPAGARVGGMAGLAGGGLVVADAAGACLWRVDPGGRVEPFAGRPRAFSLDRPRRGSDGTVESATFRAPGAVAEAAGSVFCADAAPDGVALRRVRDGRVETLDLGALARVAALAAAPGGLYVAGGDAPATCLYLLREDGGLSVVAGSPHEAGDADGDGLAARFAHVAALAPDGAGGCYVADGARVRHVAADGRVTTVAGAAPGFADGPAARARFGAVRALAAAALDGAPSGRLVVSGGDAPSGPDGLAVRLLVADPDNRAVRMVAGGEVSTIHRDPKTPAPLLDEAGARALSRRFGGAIVDGDVGAALEAVDAFLADHRRRGGARPNRLFLPASVASARVGRELALSWCVSGDRARARLGAFCLWLVRAEERAAAPRSDAARVVAEIARAIDAGDVARASVAAGAVPLAFAASRRRDRLALAAAWREAGALERGGALLASPDAEAQRLGVSVAEQSRDVRLTPPIAALALSDGPLADEAARALRAIWGEPCHTRDQVRELREGLRFSRPALERLLASGVLEGRALARLAEAIETR